MNLAHRLCRSSNYWARTVEQKLLPWVLRDIDLGDHTLDFRDTYNPVDPATLPDRLRRAGFSDVTVDVKGGEQRWRAAKP